MKLLTLFSEDKSKKCVVCIVLQDLGDCADVLIGNEVEGIKGISGGEKRRLAVGLELVTQPSVVLLDEPTSGLDSEIALTIIKTLKGLATKGRTVRILSGTWAWVLA